MVMNDLQEIMLAVFEYHENAVILKDSLDVPDDVYVGKLGTECHFADGGLRNAGVCSFSFAVGLESSKLSVRNRSDFIQIV